MVALQSSADFPPLGGGGGVNSASGPGAVGGGGATAAAAGGGGGGGGPGSGVGGGGGGGGEKKFGVWGAASGRSVLMSPPGQHASYSNALAGATGAGGANARNGEGSAEQGKVSSLCDFSVSRGFRGHIRECRC